MPVTEEFKQITEAKLKPATVLVVDDEVNILKSIKRLLHKCDYNVVLADSGEKGLAIMAEHNIDLVICDMRMPNMSGAVFFAKVATTYPETYRILLTGFADIESTIDAINEGKIHRYIQKPWDNNGLISSIEEGLEKVRLKQENIRLQSLIKRQNTLLKELNHNLEEKVQLRTKQINIALTRIERDKSATQKVLYNFISINPNLEGGFANSVSSLAKQIAQKLKLEKKEVDEITYAGLLSEIGLLGLDTAVYSQPFNELNFSQQEGYMEQINKAQLILGPATHLQGVSDIITCQFEHVNGTGPNKLDNTQIPTGAKILSIARDFWRYSLGKITVEKMNIDETLGEMKKFKGTKYDPTILDTLISNKDIISDKYVETPIGTDALQPGMVLKYNIFNDAHILVLPEGHVFSEATIAKLIKFEKSQDKPFSLVVEDIEVVEE